MYKENYFFFKKKKQNKLILYNNNWISNVAKQGSAIYIQKSYFNNITSNFFYKNKATGGSTIMSYNCPEVIIENCKFSFNNGFKGGFFFCFFIF